MKKTLEKKKRIQGKLKLVLSVSVCFALFFVSLLFRFLFCYVFHSSFHFFQFIEFSYVVEKWTIRKKKAERKRKKKGKNTEHTWKEHCVCPFSVFACVLRFLCSQCRVLFALFYHVSNFQSKLAKNLKLDDTPRLINSDWGLPNKSSFPAKFWVQYQYNAVPPQI